MTKHTVTDDTHPTISVDRRQKTTNFNESIVHNHSLILILILESVLSRFWVNLDIFDSIHHFLYGFHNKEVCVFLEEVQNHDDNSSNEEYSCNREVLIRCL